MFGRKKNEGEPDQSKLVAVDGKLSELAWKPLTRDLVDNLDVVQMLDELPVEMRQMMLEVSAKDAVEQTDEKMRNAARFFAAYLSGNIDEAEVVAAEGVIGLKNGFKLGDGTTSIEARKVEGTDAEELLRLIDEVGDDTDKAARMYREQRDGERGERFDEAWARFSEETGVDIKVIRLASDDFEGGDRFKFVVEIPERAAMMLHHGNEMGVAHASEQMHLGILRPGVTAAHVLEAAYKLGVPHGGTRTAVMAMNLLFGKIAMRGAEFSVEGTVDEESIEVAVETTDAVWKEALDEANAPVETPHDMAKYITWLQSEKKRLESELAAVTNGGGEETKS